MRMRAYNLSYKNLSSNLYSDIDVEKCAHQWNLILTMVIIFFLFSVLYYNYLHVRCITTLYFYKSFSHFHWYRYKKNPKIWHWIFKNRYKYYAVFIIKDPYTCYIFLGIEYLKLSPSPSPSPSPRTRHYRGLHTRNITGIPPYPL